MKVRSTFLINWIEDRLDRLNPNKAWGPDDRSARVLKECSAEIAQVLACIFNQSLIHATVPDDLHQANVAPIYKKEEKYDPANYRPVSLTCICCNAQVICNPAPPPTGIAGLMCGAMTFWVPPQYRVSAGLVILRKYTPRNLLL